MCIGDTLAKMELYLFAGAILQRFRISQPDGVRLDDTVNPDSIVFNTVKPYKVVLTKRNAI